MLLRAKWQSICYVCQNVITVGSSISWVKGEKRSAHALCSQEGKDAAVALEASRAADSAFQPPCPAGKSYLPYQRAGISYALNRTATLIADEQGLGKTIQAIGIINSDDTIRTVLIVCPASLKINWRNECAAWLTRDLTVAIFPEFGAVTIINYDQLKKLPKGISPDLLVCDEAHYVKNAEAKRSKAVKDIAKRAKRRIFLTGTPMPSRPLELWSLLQMLDPLAWDPAGKARGKLVDAGEGAGFTKFAWRYCAPKQVEIGWGKAGWDFTGSSNLEELQERLRTTIMVRRMKADVLTELPPKTRQCLVLARSTTPLSAGVVKAMRHLDAEFDPDARETSGFLLDESRDYNEVIAGLRADKVLFEEISKTRHMQALAKVDAVVDFVSDALQQSDKIILFCHHRDVLDLLHSGLDAVTNGGVVCIHGDTPKDDSPEGRNAQVKRFQTDPSVRVILGTFGPMGTGLTLTASQDVIFAEDPWTPAEVDQAEDRAHRIGQAGNVLCRHLVVDGTLDAKIVKMLVRKQGVIHKALNGIIRAL